MIQQCVARRAASSVFATRLKNAENRQVRLSEEPTFGTLPGYERATNRSDVLLLREIPQMCRADSRDTGSFGFGEESLTELDRGHNGFLLIRGQGRWGEK